MTVPRMTAGRPGAYDAPDAWVSEPDPEPIEVPPGPHPLARFGLRFVFAYFALYTFPGPLGAIPGVGFLFGWWDSAATALTLWTGAHILGVTRPMPDQPTGSGDTMIAYVSLVVYVALGLMVAAAWSYLDRRRANDERVKQWMIVYLRFTLAFIMFSYGFAKIYMAQFPPLSPDRLVQTLGEMSPMGLVWTFMAFSKPYNMFAGVGEALGGFLMCFRRTATLGALVSTAVLANIVALNFMYDVPVKQYSAHLIVMAMIIAAADLRRLANVLIFNRPTESQARLPLWPSRRVQRVMTVATGLLVANVMFGNFTSSRSREVAAYAAPTTSPLWGVYEITELRRNGVVAPLVVTDNTAWRRVVFGSFNRATVRLMGDSAVRFTYAADSTAKTLKLTSRVGTADSATFIYSRPDAAHLVLAGRFKSDSVVMQLVRSDKTYLLTSRGYNWVQELPFNR